MLFLRGGVASCEQGTPVLLKPAGSWARIHAWQVDKNNSGWRHASAWKRREHDIIPKLGLTHVESTISRRKLTALNRNALLTTMVTSLSAGARTRLIFTGRKYCGNWRTTANSTIISPRRARSGVEKRYRLTQVRFKQQKRSGSPDIVLQAVLRSPSPLNQPHTATSRDINVYGGDAAASLKYVAGGDELLPAYGAA